MKNSPLLRILASAIPLLIGTLASNAAFADEPYFARYPMGEPQVLDYGAVASLTPHSVLAELFRRDRILRKALSPLTLRIHAFDKGPDMTPFMANGKLDAAILGDTPILEAAARGQIQVLGLVRQSYSGVISTNGMTMEKLKGKRIGVPLGTSAQEGLLYALDSAGLAESDVTLVAMNITDMPEALFSGRVQAISAIEPTLSILTGKYPDKFTILHKQQSSAFLTVSRQFAQSQPEATLQLAAATARAIRWLRKDRANLQRASHWAVQALSRFSNKEGLSSEKEFARLTQGDALRISGVPALPSEAHRQLGRSFTFMQKQGKLPSTSRWEDTRPFFDPSLMAQVLANPRRYRLEEADYEY